jgi:hypothetical protein
MKYTIHVPVEQYGYIEGTYDTIPGAIEGYREISKAWKAPVEPENGLNLKDWQKTLDNYLMTGRIDGEAYEKMSDKQKGLIGEVKRSLTRIKAKDDTGRINKEEDIRYN